MANNVFGGRPNCVVAKQTIDFISAGLTAGNTEIIYEVDDPLKSYIPGRPINGTSGFTKDKGYYMIPKIDMDLSAIVVPPTSAAPQLAAPATFTATTASDTQINLAWAAVTNATGYVVDRATNSGFTAGVDLAIYSGNLLSFNDTSRAPGTQYFYRIRSTAAGYTDSTYSSANATTTNSGSVQNLIWAQLQNGTTPSAGNFTASGTLPSGATATKKLTKATGNYVQYTITSPASNCSGAALVLCAADDANYAWGNTGNAIIAAIYQYTGTASSTTTNTGTTGTSLGSIAAGDILRMEVSGNDLLVKKSSNGGVSFTTIDTRAGIFTGVSTMTIKAIMAVTGSIQLTNVVGLGVV